MIIPGLFDPYLIFPIVLCYNYRMRILAAAIICLFFFHDRLSMIQTCHDFLEIYLLSNTLMLWKNLGFYLIAVAREMLGTIECLF